MTKRGVEKATQSAFRWRQSALCGVTFTGDWQGKGAPVCAGLTLSLVILLKKKNKKKTKWNPSVLMKNARRENIKRRVISGTACLTAF